MKQIFIIPLLILNILSCDKNNVDVPDCSAVSCIGAHYEIELIEKFSQENYLTKNNYTVEDLILLDSDNNDIIFFLENDILTIFELPTVLKPFTLTINNDIEIIHYLEMTKPKTNECCDFGELENAIMNVNDFSVERNDIKIYL